MRLHLYEFNFDGMSYLTDVPSFTIVAENSSEAFSKSHDLFKDALDLDRYKIRLVAFYFANDDNEETDDWDFDWDFDPIAEEDCPYDGEEIYVPGKPADWETDEE